MTWYYEDPWQEAAFGRWTYRVPNPTWRASTLRLHHLATGHDADWAGQSESSAWELASGGGGRQGHAWVIALWGLFVGLLLLPARSEDLEPWETDVPASTRLLDGVAFVGWSLAAASWGVTGGTLVVALVAAAWLRRVTPQLLCPCSRAGAAAA